MDLSEALGYPFKGSNIAKILTIALVFVISGVAILVAGMALESFPLMLLIIPVLLAYGLFIGGYTISVIKSVVDGHDELPEFEVGRNIGRGFMVFLAGIVYMIPVMVIFVCMFVMMGAFSGGMQSDDPGFAGMMMICGGVLTAIVLSIVVGYSLIVGQVRYAVEDSAGSLFDVAKNFGIVMSNMGTTFGLLIRQIGLAIIFSIVSSVISGVIQIPFSSMMQQWANELNYSSNYAPGPEIIFDMGMSLVLFISLYYIVSLTINLMQGFSGAHLMAGYGIDLGMGGRKYKNEDPYDPYNM